MVVDYQRAYRIHIEGVLASLEEQARALQVARRQIISPEQFPKYVEVEKVLLSENSTTRVLSLQNHKLAQMQLKDDDGTTVIMAQYLDHVEEVLHGELLCRTITMGATAVTLITLIFSK